MPKTDKQVKKKKPSNHPAAVSSGKGRNDGTTLAGKVDKRRKEYRSRGRSAGAAKANGDSDTAEGLACRYCPECGFSLEIVNAAMRGNGEATAAECLACRYCPECGLSLESDNAAMRLGRERLHAQLTELANAPRRGRRRP